MSKYNKTQKLSSETIDTASAIAKGIQKPGQTKEQTKIITQGIQKGIAEYKKQQKSKARELDKLKKKIIYQQHNSTTTEASEHEVVECKIQWLPWSLLVFSWLAMVVYILVLK